MSKSKAKKNEDFMKRIEISPLNNSKGKPVYRVNFKAPVGKPFTRNQIETHAQEISNKLKASRGKVDFGLSVHYSKFHPYCAGFTKAGDAVNFPSQQEYDGDGDMDWGNMVGYSIYFTI